MSAASWLTVTTSSKEIVPAFTASMISTMVMILVTEAG